MTTEPKHTPGAMNAARALCLPPEWTEAAATIDRETQLPALLADNERLREALRGMLDNYLVLKQISLHVARSDAPNWIGRDMTPEDDIHVKTARAALSATERKE